MHVGFSAGYITGETKEAELRESGRSLARAVDEGHTSPG